MFAKLKKKIENEGGTVSSPDGARPRRSESITSLTGVGNSPLPSHGKDFSSPPASVTSEDPTMRDVTSARDDVVALLQKKTEQCRKMEGNVSDLAALVKDKSKTIDKLENSLKQQDEVMAKKLQEQKEEFESYRDKLVRGYQEDKLQLDRLLNTEQDLTKCRAELDSKSRQCQVAETQVEKLTDEMAPLRKRLATADSDNHRLKEENVERAELVTMLSKEKAAFDKRLDQINNELTQKQSVCNNLQAKLADVEETHKNLVRTSDLQRIKNSKIVSEKDDTIDALNERVTVLEQRIASSSLSGEDKDSAVEAERAQMEFKLTEARQQLIEIKSTWSDKITHLEEQISHLNTKIVEDGEEIANQEKMADQMKNSFEKQIEDLKTQLDDAEKRALENLELATSKDSHYDKQLAELGIQLQQEKLRGTEKDTEAARLRTQAEELRATVYKKEEEAKHAISQLESQEALLEGQVKEAKQKLEEVQTCLTKKEEEVSSLTEKIKATEVAGAGQHSTISSLERQVKDLEAGQEDALMERNKFEKHLRTSQDEKVGLLEKNADLYCQMESLKSSDAESRRELQRTLTLKAEADTNTQKTEATLRQKIQNLESQIEQSELSKAESGLYSKRIEEMENQVSSLESQLADKNRTVKKQEQMLKDLRVTLQRELKVQSLPGDDSNGGGDVNFNAASSSSSPSSNRRTADRSSSSYKPDSSSSSSLSSSSLPSSASLPVLPQFGRLPQPPHHHPNNNSNSYHPHHPSTTKGSSFPIPAVLPLDSTSPNNFHSSTPGALSSVPGGAGEDTLTAYTNHVKRDLEKDVNFVYLKHVVLKFMLSREVEALQLIKAVSMLLNFSTQEQQLMRETLEWKMSWFGSRPPGGKGQMSKR